MMELGFEESNNDFDCLLGLDFMKTEIVDDVTLGVEAESDETEFSPTHSTDSGYDGMTSPCHSLTSLDDGGAVLLDDEEMKLFPESLDREITGYLSNETSNDSVDIVSVAVRELHTPPVCDFLESEPNSSIDTTLTENTITPIVTMPQRMTRRSAKAKPVLESHHTAKNHQQVDKENWETDCGDAKLPSIKVIKVIKTPVTSSMEETQDQIYEAMEERSRKNAIQAKINREKKKAYIKSLECDVEQLKSENKTLKNKCDKMQKSYKTMEEELVYLKSVLANQSALSGLLQNIPNVKNVQLTSSFFRKRKSIESDHDYPMSKRSSSAVSGGVCLHVHQDKVSLEFCATCSKEASVNEESK